MKRKNGFTLVELLAVIAILAILVIVAMPNILGMFNEAKQNTFVTEVQKIMDAAKGEFTLDSFSHSGQTIYYSSMNNDVLGTSELNMDSSNKEYFIEMDRHGQFKRVVVYDDNFCYDIYADGTNGDISFSNSKLKLDIKKIDVKLDDVNDSNNDSIDINFNGNKYVVRGCNPANINGGNNIENDERNIYNIVKNDDIVKKYTGVHKDSVTKVGEYDIYYFGASNSTDAAAIDEKINVVFANHCWQMFRTTDIGGVKLLYNGEVDNNGKCGNDRGKHVGYKSTSSIDLSGEYYYGTDYIFDSANNKYKLSGNKSLLKWAEGTYSSIIGKYTCKSLDPNALCDKLYFINYKSLDKDAYGVEISNSAKYHSIGSGRFNNEFYSLSAFSYMYGYPYSYDYSLYSNIYPVNRYFAKGARYENGKYYLEDYIYTDGTKLTLDQAKVYHYTCIENSGIECNTLGYIYHYQENYNTVSPYVLSGGVLIEDAIKDMFENNVNSSSIKLLLEAWYEKNLKDYSSYIEDAIYCNNRKTLNLESSSWNPNANSISPNFRFVSDLTLECPKQTDQFSTSNTLAKTKYPIGLITSPEARMLGTSFFSRYGSSYGFFTMTPYEFTSYAYVTSIWYNRTYSTSAWLNDDDIKPVITLKYGIKFSNGDGSKQNPYVVE